MRRKRRPPSNNHPSSPATGSGERTVVAGLDGGGSIVSAFTMRTNGTNGTAGGGSGGRDGFLMGFGDDGGGGGNRGKGGLRVGGGSVDSRVRGTISSTHSSVFGRSKPPNEYYSCEPREIGWTDKKGGAPTKKRENSQNHRPFDGRVGLQHQYPASPWQETRNSLLPDAPATHVLLPGPWRRGNE